MEIKLRIQELFSRFAGKDRRTRLIVALGLTGILLIFLSQFLPSGTRLKAESTAETITADVYVQELEQSLKRLIEKIEGAGEASVMVTLQNDWENLYVKEERTESETGENISRQSLEEAYVLVDGENGRTALIRTRLEPVVKGVVVICEGGDNPVVASRILEAVTTALDIRSNKVCITK